MSQTTLNRKIAVIEAMNHYKIELKDIQAWVKQKTGKTYSIMTISRDREECVNKDKQMNLALSATYERRKICDHLVNTVTRIDNLRGFEKKICTPEIKLDAKIEMHLDNIAQDDPASAERIRQGMINGLVNSKSHAYCQIVRELRKEEENERIITMSFPVWHAIANQNEKLLYGQDQEKT